MISVMGVTSVFALLISYLQNITSHLFCQEEFYQ
nr:MAG TPA: hypothetical protein [Caudoviricetes sp.]